jgi:hypothetical protein
MLIVDAFGGFFKHYRIHALQDRRVSAWTGFEPDLDIPPIMVPLPGHPSNPRACLLHRLMVRAHGIAVYGQYSIAEGCD